MTGLLVQTTLGGVKENDFGSELSRQIITLLCDRDNPSSVCKAIDLIQSACPGMGAEELICHIQYVDDTGRVVPDEETGLPTTIIKADWLAV